MPTPYQSDTQSDTPSVVDLHTLHRPLDVSLTASLYFERLARAILREHGRESALAVAEELKEFIGQKVAAAMDGSDWRQGSDFDTIID